MMPHSILCSRSGLTRTKRIFSPSFVLYLLHTRVCVPLTFKYDAFLTSLSINTDLDLHLSHHEVLVLGGRWRRSVGMRKKRLSKEFCKIFGLYYSPACSPPVLAPSPRRPPLGLVAVVHHALGPGYKHRGHTLAFILLERSPHLLAILRLLCLSLAESTSLK